MNCKNCGAPLKTFRCEYCDSIDERLYNRMNYGVAYSSGCVSMYDEWQMSLARANMNVATAYQNAYLLNQMGRFCYDGRDEKGRVGRY